MEISRYFTNHDQEVNLFCICVTNSIAWISALGHKLLTTKTE